jgi:hypothetical protein
VLAAIGLGYQWIYVKDTTVMVSTTTKDALDMRIWGSMMELYTSARELRPWLEGHAAPSKHRLTMRPMDFTVEEVADKRDGIIGIACKVGEKWVGISNYVGLKNHRVLLIADEGHLMSHGFLDSVSNLRKNPVFKLVVLGNPKDPKDPLGEAAEPAAGDGGWDGYSPEKKTKVWKTRSEGVAIQLCGLDSPNFHYPRGLNPYKHLIRPEQIEQDIREYGEDSEQASMMNYGIMPRTGTKKRVIDMLMCERHRAFEEPIWSDVTRLTRCAGLDAAYSGTGGDRCVFTELLFGQAIGGIVLISVEAQVIVPINPALKIEAEDQITNWCSAECTSRGIKPENFGIDSTGRGTLVSSMARHWSPSILAIEFGGTPSKDRNASATDHRKEYDVYGKQVTALWYASRLVVLGNQFRKLPRNAVEEASMRDWMVVKNRNVHGEPLIDVEPKDKMKVRVSRSPDLWDSLCVALEVARRRGFEIAGGIRIGVEGRKNAKWLQDRAARMNEIRQRQTLVYA